jgi:hypothetical protein
MKSEERHRLETNTLATELNIWGEKLRPYSSAILFAIAAVLGMYAALSLWNARSATRQQQAWDDYELALLNSDMDYRNVYRVANNEDLAGTRMQDWAYLAWADRQLLLAAQNYLLDRDAAKTRLTEIKAVYDTYSTQALEPEVRNRALFGLARVNEIENDLDAARKNYAQVEGALSAVAEARLKELETRGKEIEEVNSWLATADLPRPVAPQGGGTPGVRPDFDVMPPATGTGTDPFNPGDMFDVLGGAGGTDAGPRYGEPEATAPASDAEAAGSDAEAPAADEDSTAEPVAEAETSAGADDAAGSTEEAQPAEPASDSPPAAADAASDAAPADVEPADEPEPRDQP